MSIQDQEVRQVARLARLAIEDEEVEVLRAQLDQILDYVAQLDELELDEVEAAPYPFALTLTLREDVGEETLTPEQALNNAPAATEGGFSVPRVLGG